MATKPKGPNVALLRRLARKLRRLRHEEHYDQASYGRNTNCGTAACVAGHALIESGYKFLFGVGGNRQGIIKDGKTFDSFDVSDLAGIELGLSYGDSATLFSASPNSDWPEPFRSRWAESDDGGTERPSRIAADYLDHLADVAEGKS